MSRNVGLRTSPTEPDVPTRTSLRVLPPTLFLSLPPPCRPPSEAPSCWRARRLRCTCSSRRCGPRRRRHPQRRAVVRHGWQPYVCGRREHVRGGWCLLPDRRGQEGAQRGEYAKRGPLHPFRRTQRIGCQGREMRGSGSARPQRSNSAAAAACALATLNAAAAAATLLCTAALKAAARGLLSPPPHTRAPARAGDLRVLQSLQHHGPSGLEVRRLRAQQQVRATRRCPLTLPPALSIGRCTGRWGRGRECTGSCPPLSIGRLDLASARRHPLSSPRSAVTFWHPRPSTRSRTTAWNGRSL